MLRGSNPHGLPTHRGGFSLPGYDYFKANYKAWRDEELIIMNPNKKSLEPREATEYQPAPLRVPGIEVAISELRLRYPSLTDEAIARILGFPSDQVFSTSSNPLPEILTPGHHSENNR